MAVAVDDHGRLTVRNGDAETPAGSGDPVSAYTVNRSSSVSKRVAATMLAKPADHGKVALNAPIVNYSTTLHLPARAELLQVDITVLGMD